MGHMALTLMTLPRALYSRNRASRENGDRFQQQIYGFLSPVVVGGTYQGTAAPGLGVHPVW